jgi:hypothetical protein
VRDDDGFGLAGIGERLRGGLHGALRHGPSVAGPSDVGCHAEARLHCLVDVVDDRERGSVRSAGTVDPRDYQWIVAATQAGGRSRMGL